MSNKIRVGVLRGGPSSEYEVSLKTGAAVLEHLSEETYESLDVFVDRNGVWHIHGTPSTPGAVARRIDVALNAMHGEYGEDGQVQQVLEQYRIPYTGSGVAASALAMHKGMTKQLFHTHGIRTPLYALVRAGEDIDKTLHEVFRAVPGPYVVKPARGGSSIGVAMADTFEELAHRVKTLLEYAPQVLVEQRIKGREATVGVVEGFRGEEHYALPPVEIIPPSSSPFFDYDAKYSGETQEICPGNFSSEVKHELQELAKAVHKALRLRHYSRTDFMISPRGIYVLEVNTLPGLTEESLLPKSVAAVGTTFPEFLEHLISLALR